MIPFFAFLQSAPQTDALTRLLHQQQLTPWMIAAAIGIAFALGAAHALTPGHGKTIVAAGFESIVTMGSAYHPRS